MNVILVYVDDLGFRDLSCYGSTFYETPNIDRLAEEGVIFSDAYASCPVCSPSRASLLTGKYPARVGVTDWIGAHLSGRLIDAPYTDHLPLDEDNLAKCFRRHGYATYHVGKWHLGGEPYYPEHQGFDVNVGGCHFGQPVHGYFSPYRIPTLADGPEGEYLTDRLTDEAIGLIRKSEGRPFFLYYAPYAVHIPLQAKECDIDKFRRKAHSLKLDMIDPFVEGEAFPTDDKKGMRVKRRIVQSDPVYAAMIYNLDQNIGRLVETLRERGLYDDTLIVFSSDNGGLATAEGSPTCNFPAREGKGWLAEGGIREPLIFSSPKLRAKSPVIDEPVSTVDLLPTLLGICGIEDPITGSCDGTDLRPLFAGQKSLGRDGIFWHYPHYGNQGGTPSCAIRSGNWKLVRYFEDGRQELFDVVGDISESHDMASERPDLVATLGSRLDQWLQSVGAVFPEKNPDYLPTP